MRHSLTAKHLATWSCMIVSVWILLKRLRHKQSALLEEEYTGGHSCFDSLLWIQQYFLLGFSQLIEPYPFLKKKYVACAGRQPTHDLMPVCDSLPCQDGIYVARRSLIPAASPVSLSAFSTTSFLDDIYLFESELGTLATLRVSITGECFTHRILDWTPKTDWSIYTAICTSWSQWDWTRANASLIHSTGLCNPITWERKTKAKGIDGSSDNLMPARSSVVSDISFI